MAAIAGYRYAGFWWRVLAYFIDDCILTIASTIAIYIIAIGMGVGGYAPGMVRFFGTLLTLIWCWLYFALLESSAMRATLGKRACGLVVTDEDGRRISFGRATGRYFAKYLSALILFVGFMMAGWTRRKQALHDKIADTLVLKLLPEAAASAVTG